MDVFIPPYSVERTHVDLAQQTLDYWHPLIKVLDAHQDNQGEKAVIYILDTAKEWFAPDINKAGNAHAFDGTGQPDDAGNHGHLCAGVSSALNNDLGVLGVAPRSLPIPVKGLHVSSGAWSWIMNCIDHIIKDYTENFKGSKVGIINMSFGSTGAYAPLKAKLQEAIDAGLIPVAAAGNTGSMVTYPGAWDDVCITVPALDRNSNLAGFSARGPATDIAGYGVSVMSTAPDGTYPRVSGTSFSSPMIAGVCAVVGTRHFGIFGGGSPTNKDVMEQHLKKFAKDIFEPGEDDASGAGIAVIPPYLANNPGGDNPPDDPGEEPDEPGDNPKFPDEITFEVSGEITLKVKKNDNNS